MVTLNQVSALLSVQSCAGRQVLRELLSTYNVADPGSDFYIPPEEKNEEGDTALMLACKAPEGSDEVVEMLLDAFPDQDLDVKDARGRAVWHLVPPSRSSVIVMLQRADERQRRLLGEEGWPNWWQTVLAAPCEEQSLTGRDCEQMCCNVNQKCIVGIAAAYGCGCVQRKSGMVGIQKLFVYTGAIC
eukprot:1159541-Pelagomonas_calceolata.AAC.1